MHAMVVLIAKFRELSRRFSSTLQRPFQIPKARSTTTLALLSSLLKVFHRDHLFTLEMAL